ncbi:MAG: hypothetical protein A3F14_02710 [Gammaproteobacteria bacterium RIFCSPHIGHO2_12_FULL_43_28]|nr:MAG: hypothetical protein A3F14_02710 [Gammaproteobacteria bacterium RIFCSPHIGHO2_12_FULL_43_28]
MVRVANLEIHKEELAFSAGHFTIFSATEREQLHGHNYYVSADFLLSIGPNGLAFDYRHYKKKLITLCDKLDRHFLLPSKSPYMPITEEGDYWVAHYNHKKLFFLKEDVILLPLTNITIEELAHWFLQNMLVNEEEMRAHAIYNLAIKVYNGPGQSARAAWEVRT